MLTRRRDGVNNCKHTSTTGRNRKDTRINSTTLYDGYLGILLKRRGLGLKSTFTMLSLASSNHGVKYRK